MKNPVVAIIQYGIMGYVLEDNVKFSGVTVDEVIEKINKKTNTLSRQIEASQEKNGDLRVYTPQFANGYPSLGCWEVEFGDDFAGCLLTLTIGDRELAYNTKGYTRLRKATGLD